MICQTFLEYLPFNAAPVMFMKVDERENIAMIGFKDIFFFSLKGSHGGVLGRKVNWLAK